MNRSFWTIAFFSYLVLWLVGMPSTAQVIFKVASPIKRHEQRFTQQSLGTPEGGERVAITIDSLEIESNDSPLADSILPSDSSTSSRENSAVDFPSRPVSQKPQFQVTYMGAPLARDTSERSRYHLVPLVDKAVKLIKRYVADSVGIAAMKSAGQDSIMIAVLEDSLRRIREQLIPLRQSTQSRAKSAFDLYRSIPSILPVRLRSLEEFRVSSTYGLRVHPISGRLQNHEGIDLPQPRFTAVYATADGVVDRVIWQPNGMGLAIYIVHPSGYQTGYGHLEDHSVLVGEHVRRGQVIGRVGSTGLSTGPHLHYTVLAGTQPVDPASYCFLLLNALEDSKSSVSRPLQTLTSDRR